MNWILLDGIERLDMLPLTFAKPICELRIGIITIKNKWEIHLGESCSYMTDSYLAGKYELTLTDDNLVINSSVLPNPGIVSAIRKIRPGQRMVQGNTVIAFRLSGDDIANGKLDHVQDITTDVQYDQIRYPWDIFSLNGEEIRNDIKLLNLTRKSINKPYVRQIGEDLYVDENVDITDAVINSSTGPVYLGKDVLVMEGAMIRGPFVACEGAVIKMGAKMYADTTIGPFSKVGGEISNSVILAYSNKGHDGYLGNSVIGEWCNLGADTNNSNLKNNYGQVKLWNYKQRDYINTGLTFCGLIMGDHSKTSINTMLNTGTVVGFSSNIFTNGFPPKYVPSFTWGGGPGSKVYDPDKAFEVASRVMARRNLVPGDVDKEIFSQIFAQTKPFRSF